ncbi:MAG: quinoprotein glucose dehydrogenase [Bryobacterales bacterium]|nr:quinoprotein glucose dehydrogenase [Bryobacterales bacterium]
MRVAALSPFCIHASRPNGLASLRTRPRRDALLASGADHAANMAKLKLGWTFDTEAAAPPPPARAARKAYLWLSTGVVFIGTAYSRVVALEPETARKLWEYESAHTPALRGIAYWSGTKELPPQIVFGTADGFLISLNISLNAKSGTHHL